MGVDEQSVGVDSEEIVDEGNGDTEGNELSAVSGLNGEGMETNELQTHQTHPVPEEINRTIERPLGAEEDKVFEQQERGTTRTMPKSNPTKKKESKEEQLTHKLYNQLIKKLQSDKTRDEIKQIQKMLAQVEKNTASVKQQQELGKQLLVQVKLMQKRLEKINSTISHLKSSQSFSRKKTPTKSKKKIK
jgi:hypothetical protein